MVALLFDDMIISLFSGRWCWHGCVKIEHLAKYPPTFACLFPDYEGLPLVYSVLSGIEEFDSSLLRHIFRGLSK